jgi:hypothetical protein
MKHRVRILAALCVVATTIVTTKADQVPRLNRVMREKMGHAQAILAGVITNDWSALDRESRALALAVRDPAWSAALTGADYIRQSDAFSRALQDLIEASARRDLDAAANAQIELTTTCVRCHVYMSRRRIAK